MAISQQQYQMTAEEAAGGASGLSAYNTRIAGLRSAETPTPSSPTGGGGSDLLSQIQNKLMSNTGAVSSDKSALDQLIQDAQAEVTKAGEATQTGTKASFERQKIEAQDVGTRTMTALDESRRGFATNTALVRQVQEATDKSLRDLDLREQEALAAGQHDTASKLADLKIQQLQFNMQYQQQAFSNLLATGNFLLAGKQEQRLESAQSFTEKQALGTIALQYGIKLQEGDTIDSVIARAQPFASEKQQLELQKIRADIAKSNAEAAKASQGLDFTLDDITAGGIAGSIYTQLQSGDKNLELLAQTTLQNIIDKKGAAGQQMINKAFNDIVNKDFSKENIQEMYASGLSFADISDRINRNPFASQAQKDAALKLAKSSQTSSSSGTSSFSQFLNSFLNFGKGPTQSRFDELDRKFRGGQTLTPSERTEYTNLGKALKIF